MKIAVQLYGHLRTFELCAPALREHVLNHYDCDVFIHTWDRTEHTSKSWYADSVRADPTIVTEATIEKLHQLYAPKGLKIETQGFLNEAGYFGTSDRIKISLLGMKYMAYGQYQANVMREAYEREHGLQYDYVLVLRPDIMPYRKVDFRAFENEFAYHERVSIHLIHSSEMHQRKNKFFNYPLVADCFYFSKPHLVTEITNLFLCFDRYLKEINLILPEGVENPEVGFFEHILQKNIIPRQYQFFFAIKRNDPANDIRRLPPDAKFSADPAHPVSQRRVIARALLQAYVRFAPSILLRATRSALRYASVVGSYIESLERLK